MHGAAARRVGHTEVPDDIFAGAEMHGAAARRVGHTEVPDENRFAILTPPLGGSVPLLRLIRHLFDRRGLHPASLGDIRCASLQFLR